VPIVGTRLDCPTVWNVWTIGLPGAEGPKHRGPLYFFEMALPTSPVFPAAIGTFPANSSFQSGFSRVSTLLGGIVCIQIASRSVLKVVAFTVCPDRDHAKTLSTVQKDSLDVHGLRRCSLLAFGPAALKFFCGEVRPSDNFGSWTRNLF
jgi:hypothetical protein